MALISTHEMTIWIMVLAYLFGPGWLLILWFFPDERPSWQIAVGGGIGIAVLGLIALCLSYLPLGITQASVLIVSVGLNGLCVIPFCVAPEHAIQRLFRLLSSLGLGGELSWKEYVTPALTLLSLSAFLIVAPFLSRGDRQSYTEFYIAEGFQDAPPWRRSVSTFAPVSLTFVVVSSEKTVESFQVHVVTEGETIQVVHLGGLEPGASVEQSISVQPRIESEQPYTLILYKGDAGVPYRTLSFWLRTAPVTASSSAEEESTLP